MLEQKNKQPFFSVLIPVFNGDVFVAECINSILTQSFVDFELLICDDASTDKTLEILEQFAKQDSRIRILKHVTNKRALIARNNLVRSAKGKYCIFADADDELLPDFLETAKKILDKKHYDIIQFSFFTRGSNPNFIKRMGYFSNKDLTGEKILDQYLFGFPNIFAPFAKVYDRELLLKSLPEDRILPFIDDIPLTIQAAHFAKSYLSLKKKKYIFHHGSGGFSKKQWSDGNIKDFCISASDILREFENFSQKNYLEKKYYYELETKMTDNLFTQINNLDPLKKANALRIYLQYFDGSDILKDFILINKQTPLSVFIKGLFRFVCIFVKRIYLRLIGKKNWIEP